MNYFELYPGDYLRDTGRLSLLEHGAYFRLMLAYYGEGQPFPDDMAELYIAAGAATAADKAAVRKVADKYFPVAADGLRRNNRADQVIALAEARMEEQPADRKATQAERAKRYRERRSAMFALLREHGVVMDFNAKSEDLEAAVMQLASRNASRSERDDSRDERDGVQRDVTASRPQTPDPTYNNGSSRQAPEIPQGQGTDAGLACRLMREAGCAQTNPSHPDLIAALAEGVTPQALADTAREAAAGNVRKPFAYAIATARGRHAEGAKPTTGATHVGPHQRGNGRRLSAVEQVEQAIADRHEREAREGQGRTLDA